LSGIRPRTRILALLALAAIVAATAWALRGSAEADGCSGRGCHPAPPRAVRVVERGPTSITLAWRRTGRTSPRVEIFVNGRPVALTRAGRATITRLRCATRYRLTTRTRDIRGRRSGRVTLFVTTAPCPTRGNPAPSPPTAPPPSAAPAPPAAPPAPSGPPDTTAPTAPKAVRIQSVTSSTVSVTWTAASDDVAVAAYNLLVDGARAAQTTATTTFTFSNLTCATKYTLGVQAVDTSGNVSAVTTGKAKTGPCPPPPGSAGCPSSPLKGVQVPGHLKVLDRANPCRTAVGVVTSTQPQADGDCHVRIKVDASYDSLLVSGNHGELVTEVIPKHRVPIPKAGSRVSVMGTWVRDLGNAWNELHPVWSFQVISGSTGSC
jgi:hypothetical protein